MDPDFMLVHSQSHIARQGTGWKEFYSSSSIDLTLFYLPDPFPLRALCSALHARPVVYRVRKSQNDSVSREKQSSHNLVQTERSLWCKKIECVGFVGAI